MANNSAEITNKVIATVIKAKSMEEIDRVRPFLTEVCMYTLNQANHTNPEFSKKWKAYVRWIEKKINRESE